MTVYGLTGKTGAGKSTVAAFLKEKGFYIIDGDVIARHITDKGKPALKLLSEHFGADIINADGTLNRKLLASRAFSSPENTAVLNSITHPLITEEFEKEIDTNSFYFYFDEDGDFFIANSSDYDSAMHTYIKDEERSTESNGECEYIYYSSYKCSKCDSSYTNYFTDGHSQKLTYSYKDGVYYATLSCTVCEKIFDNQATFTLESDITTEYYENDTYAGFTVTIDEATAGKYYVYSESDEYADTYIDVYKVNSEGELDSVDSEDGGEPNGNFGLDVELEAGATYVFAPRMYYSSSLNGSPNVTVFLEKIVEEAE